MSNQKSEEVVAYRINVNGIVQGVGYRPFVYRIATELGLNGFVLNSGNGVIIEVEGKLDDCLKFIERLRTEKPPRAIVKNLVYERIPLKGYGEFKVEKTVNGEVETLCPPDVAVCQDCLNELFNQVDRRYLYPFIN
ncbi:MAG: acylphosphatase, partial [Thermoproteota archaeon]